MNRSSIIAYPVSFIIFIATIHKCFKHRGKKKPRRALQLTKPSKPDRAVKRLRNPIRKGLTHSSRVKETYYTVIGFSRNRQQLETVEKYPFCTAQLGEFFGGNHGKQ